MPLNICTPCFEYLTEYGGPFLAIQLLQAEEAAIAEIAKLLTRTAAWQGYGLEAI